MEQSDPYWKTIAHYPQILGMPTSNQLLQNLLLSTLSAIPFWAPHETIEGDETTLHDHIDEKPHAAAKPTRCVISPMPLLGDVH